MKNMRKIGVVAVMAGFAVTAGLTALLSTGQHWRAYTVQGGSMQPGYDQGDLIITSQVAARDIQPGQVIVFVADWASEKYEHRVVHRVSAVGEIDGLPVAFTRGDANLVADPGPVDLTGEVRAVRMRVPAGGLWLEWMAGPFVIAVLATIAAGFAGASLSGGMQLAGATFRQLRRTALRQPADHVPPVTDLRIHY